MRLFICLVLLMADAAVAQGLRVVASVPEGNALDANVDAAIELHFDRAVDRSSVVPHRTLWAFGRWSGRVEGTISFARGDSVVRLTPSLPLSAGERVLVVVSHDLRAADGTNLRQAGYSFRFWTRAARAALDLREVDRLATRDSPTLSTRAYGGIASDLNADRWLDILIVNEDTADLRVFLNSATGDGLFGDFLRPPAQVNAQASPSEPADFNHDGIVDVCVANIRSNSVSVLLGNGDGTFAPQQEIRVGLQPRGITVLDADGDGDLDIVNSNSGSSNLSLLLNDGKGVFLAPQFFEGGGEAEWALEASDMDGDGILDLVVGAQASQAVVVNRGVGDGSFVSLELQSCGGAVWMLVCADVDGDGHEDVSVVNSSSDSGAILLGDGSGSLEAPSILRMQTFPLATDLGDLDGDGDLDWMTSSFGGGWQLFLNGGSGNYKLERVFAAPQAASCALLFDANNDGDLDLALVDELEDVVLIMENSGSTPVQGESISRLKSRFR
ncbi:MAG: VCBS repeat-containing protein [Candidatus Latescibacterota bacterium]|nr:MAG: VCBS repeat-containing protein [Candidatus Latescibacterota bacterium]